MAFLFFIVEWAYTHGKMPSEVYQQYLGNPRDFQLLMAFRNDKIGEENKQIEAQKKPLGGSKKPF